MADKTRTESMLISAYADNTAGLITAQAGRDFITSVFPYRYAGDPTVDFDNVNTAGVPDADGFDTGSWLLNVLTGRLWWCQDGPPGAAIWWKMAYIEDVGGGVEPPGSVLCNPAGPGYLSTVATGFNPPAGTSWTVVLWVNLATFAGDHVALHHTDGTLADVIIDFWSNGVSGAISNGSYGGAYLVQGGLTAGVWYCVAFGYDQATGKQFLQVAGKERVEGIPSFTLNPAIVGWLVGARNFSNTIGYTWDGQIDSLAFFSKALTVDDVECLANDGDGLYFNQLESALIPFCTAWWDFSEASGNRIDAVAGYQLTPTTGVSKGPGIPGFRAPCPVPLKYVHAWLTAINFATACKLTGIAGSVSSGSPVITLTTPADADRFVAPMLLWAPGVFPNPTAIISVDRISGTVTCNNDPLTVGAITFDATPYGYDWEEIVFDPVSGAPKKKPGGMIGSGADMPAFERNYRNIAQPNYHVVLLELRETRPDGMKLWEFDWIPAVTSNIDIGDPNQTNHTTVNVRGGPVYDSIWNLSYVTINFGNNINWNFTDPLPGSSLPKISSKWVKVPLSYASFLPSPSASKTIDLYTMPVNGWLEWVLADTTQQWATSPSPAFINYFANSTMGWRDGAPTLPDNAAGFVPSGRFTWQTWPLDGYPQQPQLADRGVKAAVGDAYIVTITVNMTSGHDTGELVQGQTNLYLCISCIE